jgi:hypothetical protein
MWGDLDMSSKDVIVLSAKSELRFAKINLFIQGKISRSQASEFLGLSERTVSRLASKISEQGIYGIMHGNLNKTPHNKFMSLSKEMIMKLVGEKYYDFNMTHGLEMLAKYHNYKIPYTVFRKWCHEKKLVKRRWKARSRARIARSRVRAAGYMLQLDGSPDFYNGVDEWHLILAIDDATSEIPYAQFFEGESTLGCMDVIKKIIKIRGIPWVIYTDRAGWSGGQKRTQFSQFKRACEELGTQVLFANSPEAKGRVERAFKTCQDRLIPEFRLLKIKNLLQANRYLLEEFLPKYWNKNNTVEPAEPKSRYRELKKGCDLEQIFCIKLDRVVGKDHVFSYQNRFYVIEGPLPKRSLAGHYIEIRLYEHQPWAVYFQHHKLKIRKINQNRKAVEPYSKEWIEDFEEKFGIRKRKNIFPEALARKEKFMRETKSR